MLNVHPEFSSVNSWGRRGGTKNFIIYSETRKM